MDLLHIAFKIFIGIIFGVIASIAFSPALAAFDNNYLMYLIIFMSIIVILFAQTILRAFAYGFFLTSVSFITLPASTYFLFKMSSNDNTESIDKTTQAAEFITTIIFISASIYYGSIISLILFILGVIFVLVDKN